MTFKTYYLTESITPKKPTTLKKTRVVKNRGMVNQKTLDQIEFNTPDGNNVKVQFDVKDDSGDVVFYVNNTLDDRGGRSDGSVDPGILSGVLWIVDEYSRRLGLNKLTFSAWSGEGDTKVVRGLDITKPRENALKLLHDYMHEVEAYEAVIIPPSERRIELARKLGREPTVVYDVNKDKLLMILKELSYEVEDMGVARSVPFEEEVYMSRGDGSDKFSYDTRLEDKIPGAMDVLEAVKRYNLAVMSRTESGGVVSRNRRADLYKRIIDRWFSDDWDVQVSGTSFELVRKQL